MVESIILIITAITVIRVRKATSRLIIRRKGKRDIMTKIITVVITTRVKATRRVIIMTMVIILNTIKEKRGRKDTNSTKKVTMEKDTRRRDTTKFIN